MIQVNNQEISQNIKNNREALIRIEIFFAHYLCNASKKFSEKNSDVASLLAELRDWLKQELPNPRNLPHPFFTNATLPAIVPVLDHDEVLVKGDVLSEMDLNLYLQGRGELTSRRHLPSDIYRYQDLGMLNLRAVLIKDDPNHYLVFPAAVLMPELFEKMVTRRTATMPMSFSEATFPKEGYQEKF